MSYWGTFYFCIRPALTPLRGQARAASLREHAAAVCVGSDAMQHATALHTLVGWGGDDVQVLSASMHQLRIVTRMLP
jgi:hypothetical protein